jgi:hypothetical protein
MTNTVRDSVRRHQSDSPTEVLSGTESAHPGSRDSDLLEPTIWSSPPVTTAHQTPGSIPQLTSHLRFPPQQVEYLCALSPIFGGVQVD